VAGGGVHHAFDVDVGGVTQKAFLLILKRPWGLGERERDETASDAKWISPTRGQITNKAHSYRSE
jgi:hypothetical protein